MSAHGRFAVHAAVGCICLGLGACTSHPAVTPHVPAQPQVAAASPLGPELGAPEPEAPAPTTSQIRRAHRARKAVRGTAHSAVARNVPSPPQSFQCHIVRQSDLAGAAASPSGTDPGMVDLFARVDPQTRTLVIERANDPVFAAAKEHCGSGTASPATVKKHKRRGGRTRPHR